jgi:CBS domain-containing protein
VRARLQSLEQLMPFATAGELLAENRQTVVTISAGAAAGAAARLMTGEDIGFLAVLEDDKLVGVLSERDIVRRMDLQPRALVRDIMTPRVHTVPPEAKVPECLAVMHREHIRHLPVMSGDTIQGVLSVRDMTASLIKRHERLLRGLEEERFVLLSPNTGSY